MAIKGLRLFASITLEDAHSKWLSWLLFLFYVLFYGCLLNNLIFCTMFLLPFLDVVWMPVSTSSFLVQLEFILFWLQNIYGLSYYLNSFKSRTSTHISSIFLSSAFFCFLFLVTPSVAVSY